MKTFFAAVLLVLSVFGASPASADDFDPNNPATFTALPASCNPEVPGKCTVQFFGNDRPIVVAWGDSHMVQQLPAIKGHTQNAQHNLVAFTMGLCPPMKVAAADNSACAQNARAAMDYIVAKVNAGKRVTVVLGGFWHFYWTTYDGPRAARAAQFRAGEAAMFSQLADLNVRLAAVSQTPTVPLPNPDPNPACNLTSASCPRATMLPDESAISSWLLSRLAQTTRHYLSSVSSAYLCTATECRVNAGDIPLYYDEVHVNVAYTHLNQASFRWLVL